MNNFIEKLKLRSPLIHNITKSILKRLTPTPTRSSTIGMFFFAAILAAMRIASKRSSEGVPIFRFSPSQIPVTSSISCGAIAIIGLAPHASSILATSLIVTIFVMSLLDEVHVDVIKGNLSEVKAVMEHGRCDGGVEVTDTADESDAKALACRAALRYGCICVITGETDYVAELCDEADCYDNNESSQMSTDATGTGVMDTGVVNAVASDADGYTHNYRVGSITGGHPMMKRVTGTGCMLSGLICAFVAADCDDKYGAVTAALSCMKSAGGLAASDMSEHGRETNSCYFIKPGNAAYRDRLIDAVYHICDGDYELM